MNPNLRKYIELCEELAKVEKILKKSHSKEQSTEVANYLNGLFRNMDVKPDDPNTNCPQVYVMFSNTTIRKGWYDGNSDEFIPYGEKEGEGRIKFDRKHFFGWCYHDELFPDTHKLDCERFPQLKNLNQKQND